MIITAKCKKCKKKVEPVYAPDLSGKFIDVKCPDCGSIIGILKIDEKKYGNTKI
jgi:DNA-directed RNA polymerase subunit RPC12/RpoP